jgi:hypothetical protein
VTKEMAKVLTVVTTFGLPMGVKPATDIFQARMVSVFMSMPKNRPKPYIDDIFHGKGSAFDEHLEILAEIFRSQPRQERALPENKSGSFISF